MKAYKMRRRLPLSFSCLVSLPQRNALIAGTHCRAARSTQLRQTCVTIQAPCAALAVLRRTLCADADRRLTWRRYKHDELVAMSFLVGSHPGDFTSPAAQLCRRARAKMDANIVVGLWEPLRPTRFHRRGV